MTNPERAQQFWSLLVLAAREQKVLSYSMIQRMTGMFRLGEGQPLGHIYYYCKRHDLPLLNLLAINQDTGRPGEGCPADLSDLPAQQARVFVFDWLSRDVPSTQDFEDAWAAEKGRAASAAV